MMQILLCLVSDNKPARDMVMSAKSALVPHTFRNTEAFKSLRAEIEVRAIEFGAEFAIEQFILSELDRWDGVCLLTDNLARMSARLRTSCFVGEIKAEVEMSALTAIAVRTLSNYFRLLPHMLDKGSMQALALPLNNFDADELRKVAYLCASEGTDDLFYRNFASLLARLMKRNGPRRPKHGQPKKYFQDDQKKHFDYGPEDHGQFDTGAPHTPLCEISGNFRFGWKIPTKYHYNMTKAYKDHTHIKGTFLGCHWQEVKIVGQTHANIFANDFQK
ncbi:hypothetical protein HH212_22780 [Massilia forsythiae]|uniref:Uncharacterized protein n=1 Tax=Massilia forsythiae TaxID=2728020 RepID=A0A7Z2W0A2_9BURK|nr:hypothetical protein [Massilia forsythiae]QJE02494.1 hypothetical protein HH212_22780 [Massilia forsythiae]